MEKDTLKHQISTNWFLRNFSKLSVWVLTSKNIKAFY